jgi:ammonia channel protein AmtB
LAAGLVGAYISSKGDPFFTISGGLAGIIATGAGMDIYHPALVIVLAFIAASIMPKVIIAVEKLGIDDAVGAVGVHGFCGLFGAIAVGIFAAGYPQGDAVPTINLMGQVIGAIICTLFLGFIPGYLSSLVLKKLGMLRVSREDEIAGLDLAEMSSEGYPEYASPSFVAETVSSPDQSIAAKLAME